MKKNLIIDPFKNKAGRELMTSFIANTLAIKYKVDIISITIMAKEAEILKNYNNGLVSS